MATDISTRTQVPLIITAKFDPSDLPVGMVDATDFGDFIDGLQAALNGQIDYDIQTGYIAEQDRSLYRLVLAFVRQGSVEAYLVASIFEGSTLKGIEQLLGELGAGYLILSALRQYLNSVAEEVGKRHGEYLADRLDLNRVGLYLKRFMGHVRAFTLGNQSDTAPLPPILVMSMALGMRKLGDVGARPEYQGSDGVLVSDDVMPQDVIPFNVSTRHNIESTIGRARRTGEPVDLVGLVDEPSNRHGTFLLSRPNEPARTRYLRCKVPRSKDRALIREAYAQGFTVRVVGLRYYWPNPGNYKPRSVVMVTEAYPADAVGLWHGA